MKWSPSQEFIFYRTYSRWVEELGRRETWDEAVDRYFEFMKGKFGEKVPKKVWLRTQEAVHGMDAMPSMRAFWTAGPALEKNNLVGYNCSALAFKDLQSVAELFYLLMCGCGVGFSVEKQYIEQMPAVSEFSHGNRGFCVYQVADSREGWAAALSHGLEEWFAGRLVEFDYSRIRPKGARLKTMGGRASGLEPLRQLLDFTRDVIMNARGRQLTSVEWLDIANKAGEAVHVGGIRRAAEISFSDLDDEGMRHAKDGDFPEHRWMSNNTAVYFGKPSMVEFLKEWHALAASGRGERGIFNLDAAKRASPRRVPSPHLRTNPCFAPGTLVQTREGHFPIETLVGKTVEIWNGETWEVVDNFRVTGLDQPVLKVTFHDGSEERVTPYHTLVLEDGSRVEAKDVKPGMRVAFSRAPVTHGTHKEPGAYLKGFLVGDGTTDGKLPILSLYTPKYVCQGRLIKSALEIPVGPIRTSAIPQPGFSYDGGDRVRMTGLSVRKEALLLWVTYYKHRLPAEVFAWDEASKLEFIAGVMDADGTASDTKNGWMYQVSSIHRRWLLDFQSLLKTVGVKSKLSLMHSKRRKDFGPDMGGIYDTQDCWRLTVSQQASIVLGGYGVFARLTSFADKQYAYAMKPRANRIVSIEADGIESKVYCCTIPSTHALGLTSGFFWGQCGEINLCVDTGQLCNLSEVVVRARDTFADLQEKVKSAVWLGAMQACLTDFQWVRDSFRKMCEEERLLGVSLTGQMDNPNMMSAQRLSDLKEVAIRECRKACKALGIPMSVAITTGKPSGTVSELVDCASGCHPRHAPYYIRRYRIAATDPLFKMMCDQGVPLTPENGQTAENATTWVVAFPKKAPAKAITRKDVTAIDQLEWYKKVKANWCEHNQSTTVYVRDEEWFEVGAWVYKNFDDISGVSFLPYENPKYDQLPYEEITEEQYNEMVKAFPKLDYSKLSLYEREDNTTGAQTLACVGDKCEI